MRRIVLIFPQDKHINNLLILHLMITKTINKEFKIAILFQINTILLRLHIKPGSLIINNPVVIFLKERRRLRVVPSRARTIAIMRRTKLNILGIGLVWHLVRKVKSKSKENNMRIREEKEKSVTIMPIMQVK